MAVMQSMQKFNDGYCYRLLCIDVFSKYAWVVPLKSKTGPSLDDAFKVILVGYPNKFNSWVSVSQIDRL